MTHFTVGIIVPNDELPNIDSFIAKLDGVLPSSPATSIIFGFRECSCPKGRVKYKPQAMTSSSCDQGIRAFGGFTRLLKIKTVLHSRYHFRMAGHISSAGPHLRNSAECDLQKGVASGVAAFLQNLVHVLSDVLSAVVQNAR